MVLRHMVNRAASIISSGSPSWIRRLGLVSVIIPLSSMPSKAQLASGSVPNYVNMGSSYAAGVGIGIYDTSSKGCDRSLSNYARLLSAKRKLMLNDASCSGATTADILTTSQDGNPPQIQAVNAATRLVTVTVGGNDIDYIGNLYALSCQDEPLGSGGVPRQCGVKPPDQIEALFKALPDNLAAVATAVHRRAPSAKIVFIDYLPLLPPTIGCFDKVPLSSADTYRARLTLDRLDTIIKSTAARTGSLFVASGSIGLGHDACSSDPFITGYNPPVTNTWQHKFPYHPDQAGMGALAAAIDAALGN